MSRRSDGAAGWWADLVVDATTAAFDGRGDPEWAVGAEAYMKHVAPYLGIRTPDRRRWVKEAWVDLPTPSSDELGEAAAALMDLREREYHHSAADLVGRFVQAADREFLGTWMDRLLLTKPWWDTVDAFGSAAITRLCLRDDQDAVIDRWSASGDRWLIRSAILHQRGRRGRTDVVRVLELCDRHWADREFFVAKAAGWALRDLTRIDPAAVRRFLDRQVIVNRIAQREAERGLARADRPGMTSPG